MNTKAQSLDPEILHNLLQQQDVEVNRYLETLEAIKQCICQNDSDGLLQRLQDPGLDIAHLEGLRQQLHQILVTAGYDALNNGLESCVQDMDISALTALYQKSQQNWAQFERALALNDRLIRNNQQRVRQSIQILAGRAGVESNATYSSQGDSLNYDSTQRTLAKA